MKNNIYNRIYYKLLLEEVLDTISSDDSILPQPFNNLLLHLKDAMQKALNAAIDELKLINQQVNIWKNKLMQAWRQFSNQLNNDQKTFLNNMLLDLTLKYTQYMHGCNTGY